MTKAAFSDLCRYGARLLDLPPEIDPYVLLWAIGGVESSFGANNVPRLERNYLPGGRNHRNEMLPLYEAFGEDAAKSWGPWQVMYCNAVRVLPGVEPQAFANPHVGMLAACLWIQGEIVDRQGARTVEAIGDSYNSGNHKDSFVPLDYIGKLVRHYEDELQETIT